MFHVSSKLDELPVCFRNKRAKQFIRRLNVKENVDKQQGIGRQYQSGALSFETQICDPVGGKTDIDGQVDAQ
jgi:hypothetical protein